jgi:alpha-amylase
LKRTTLALLAATLIAHPGAAQQTAPAWTRGAVCYEIFVRSFQDSDGDGIGDLPGLTSRLDYIAGLGATCVWLMPVAESPSYHGYDVSDYYRVEADYGTNDDFRHFTDEAHRRGIRVLVDMVLNHSSNRLPAFRAALRDTASPYRSWFRFSPTPRGRGPFGEGWHRSSVREEYYYGAFSRVMPDLDYHTPAVREEAKRIATFWLREMHVDGFRLDAVPFLVEDGECLRECAGTYAFLHEYAEHVRSVNPEAYTIGEATWGPLTELLPYYPDQLTSYFAFELRDSLVSALRTGQAAGLLGGYLRLQDTLPAYRWSPFLSNHDQTRVMTSLGGDMARAKLGATLLLTLPGLPFIYYGEEIGMTGDKPDERIRTPMQWRPGAGTGFTTARAWESAQPDSQTTTVAAQDADPGSLLNLYRRLIHLRRDNDALAAGRLVPVQASSPQVAAYVRRAGDHAALVVANLGGTAVTNVALDARDSTLPAGRYAPTSLLGGTNGATLQVGRDGRLRHYIPVRGPIGPRESLVLDLVRR